VRPLIELPLAEPWLSERSPDGASAKGVEELAAAGDLPPPPPGYDPATWEEGRTADGRWELVDPEGNRYYAHAEDAGHWRHWDKEGPNGSDQGRWPPNSVKPWSNQKRPPYGNQSTTDPSGTSKPWVPPTFFCAGCEMPPGTIPMIIPLPAPGLSLPPPVDELPFLEPAYG
jgi:hypothetical protein